jgi:hypothetical protein
MMTVVCRVQRSGGGGKTEAKRLTSGKRNCRRRIFIETSGRIKGNTVEDLSSRGAKIKRKEQNPTRVKDAVAVVGSKSNKGQSSSLPC